MSALLLSTDVRAALRERAEACAHEAGDEVHCIRCGCSDYNACMTPFGPCGWAWRDEHGQGVCTACADPLGGVAA